jgi:hypothetical protein
MRSFLLLLLIAGIPFSRPLDPDAAPPLQPPGSSIGPEGQTQVEMISETITLTIVPAASPPTDAWLAGDYFHADVQASFTMRNTGSGEEQLNVRFPMMNLAGWGDGYGRFPKVQDFQVRIDGVATAYTEITVPNESGYEEEPIAWASFPVSFPVNEDVLIEISYTLLPSGYFPQSDLYYLLQTGSGWKGTIGSGDVYLIFPYEVNIDNYFLDVAADSSLPAPTFEGNVVHWHFEDLEPTQDDNIGMQFLAPQEWQSVLAAREAAAANFSDPLVWMTLGDAYKDAQGYRRMDPGVRDLYNKAKDAYQYALLLEPGALEPHLNLANLILQEMWTTNEITQDMVDELYSHINYVLELEPGNADALVVSSQFADFLSWSNEKDRIQIPTAGPTSMEDQAASLTSDAAAAMTQEVFLTQTSSATLTKQVTGPTGRCTFIPAAGVIAIIAFTIGIRKNRSRRFR